MQSPNLEVIPARPAVCGDQACILDILLRITPTVSDVHFLRPPINLGIVLDRSGSMASGKKMVHASKAACFAISQLLPTDRVSVTVYDDQIETIAASAPVVDKPGLLARIQAIQPRNSTDLHGGWAAGAEQVARHVARGGLNRTLLLSDGLANVGVTDPNVIRANVKGMTGRGVSTSTIGVGQDYNEDLLEAMAQTGDGNYYYVEHSVQLADIFQTELNGLMATSGRDVGLSVQTAHGVVLLEVLNEMEREPSGRLKLPNLVMGMPISMVIRLKVPPQGDREEICQFTLDWEDPHGQAPGRRSMAAGFLISPVPARQWAQMPVAPAVAEQVALLMAAKARNEAIAAMDRGDQDTASHSFQAIRAVLSVAPQTAEVISDTADLDSTQEYFIQGLTGSARKASHYRQYFRKRGHGTTPQS